MPKTNLPFAGICIFLALIAAGNPVFADNRHDILAQNGTNKSLTLAKAATGKSSQKNSDRKGASAKKSSAPVRLHIEVPCRAWTPKKYPTMVILCVHGLGLNSASFEQFGKQMSSVGIATFAVDVRGFGSWMKLEGKEKVDFEACLTDVEKALKLLRTAYPKVPLFLLGESMGGAIALRITADHPELIDGLISAVPSGDRFHNTRNELQIAMRMVTGRMNKPMEVGSRIINQATDDPAVQERWKDDPLNRMNLTPKEHFMNENHDSAKSISHSPVLILAGFKDKLVKPQGTIELFNELSTPDKMLMIVGNGEHLIFEENQMTDQVSAVLRGWLNSHMHLGVLKTGPTKSSL
jgi:alpha-beta hydrolase superfamily lysophospholipase